MKRIVLITVTVILAVACIVTSGGRRQMRLNIHADAPGGIRVYFDNGLGLSEPNSAHGSFTAGDSQLVFALPPERVLSVRIDPDPGVPHIRLQEVKIVNPETEDAVALNLNDIRPVNQIRAVAQLSAGVDVAISAGATDPQLGLAVTQDTSALVPLLIKLRAFSRWLLASILGLWMVSALARGRNGRMAIREMMLVSCAFVIAMAVAATTMHSVHPDEFSHIPAASYFLHHWLPPSVLDPSIANTYSVYGTSYLNELDVVYLLAAKFSLVWNALGVDSVTALRLFNASLFVLLAASAWQRSDQKSGLIVLLLTPQIWYVFSYFNADAFPFFLSIAIFGLAAPAESTVSRFIEGDGRISRLGLSTFVLCLGLLLVSKVNYLPVVFTLGLWMLARHFSLRAWEVAMAALGTSLLVFKTVAGVHLAQLYPRAEWLFVPAGAACMIVFAASVLWNNSREKQARVKVYRLSILMAGALLVVLPRVALDTAVNGSPTHKGASKVVAEERYASPEFKPSTMKTNLAATYSGLNLAAKGVSFQEVVGSSRGWALNSWKSLVGVYGYMDIFAPAPLYWVFGLGMALILGSAALWAVIQPSVRMEFAILVLGLFIVLLGSSVNSWVNDFQPQGRYLFPGLAMLAAYFYSQPELGQLRLARYGTAICFVSGIISFVLVAMPAIAAR